MRYGGKLANWIIQGRKQVMQYKIQWKNGDNPWKDLGDRETAHIFDDMDLAVKGAASQAADFHAYKYRVVAFHVSEVIVTIQGGPSESL